MNLRMKHQLLKSDLYNGPFLFTTHPNGNDDEMPSLVKAMEPLDRFLTDREATAARMLEMPRKECAEILGISCPRVTQLRNQAVNRMMLAYWAYYHRIERGEITPPTQIP